jgi:hypothetical protein
MTVTNKADELDETRVTKRLQRTSETVRLPVGNRRETRAATRDEQGRRDVIIDTAAGDTGRAA